MRDYETTFILAPALDADGVQKQVDAVKRVITSHGGEITAEKEWGRRRLAFPIRDESEGIYWILRFRMEGAKKAELDRHFRLEENVLRALVIRDEGTSLDQVGQQSESHDSDSRDSRHDGRRRDFGGPRGRDRDRPPPRSAPASPSGAAPAEAASGSAAAPASAAEGEKKE